MKIDHCLILSAGFGTRMKSIGQVLPKPLWPIFEKSILELQIDYTRMLGVKNIYVNLHYRFEQVLNYFHQKEDYEDINFLIEEEILDIGGAIQNLAQKDEVQYEGNLLILNGDQFITFDYKQIEQAVNSLKNYKGVMMAVEVDPRFGHSETKVDEDFCLKKIIKSSEIEVRADKILTYSGLGLVKLNSISQKQGPSSLYQDIFDYEKNPIKMMKIDKYEYWDFGTIDRYWNSMFLILDDISSREYSFTSFLINNEAVDLFGKPFKNKGYYSKEHAINLTKKNEALSDGQIIISSEGSRINSTEAGIFYKDLFEEVHFIQKPQPV